MNEHSGRVVMVTGAARGIGRAFASAMAGAGATLAISDLSESVHDAGRAIAKDHGVTVDTTTLDVTDKAAVDRVVDDVIERHGRIDVLFNNAGIIEVQPFLDVDEATFDRIMAVNVKGVFLCGQSVARAMVAAASGCIVNVASVASRAAIPDMAAYAASKAAVMSLTRSMAVALAGHGVRVNAVAPGIVDTDMWVHIDAQRADVAKLPRGEPTRQRIAGIPLGRQATTEDVANLAMFLASDAAAYITGQTVNVDGGVQPS